MPLAVGAASGVAPGPSGWPARTAAAALGSVTHRDSTRSSCLGSIGFGTKSFMPASRHAFRSVPPALAVAAMMGTACLGNSLRMTLVACRPSISGICMSIRIASKRSGPRRIASTASRPSSAVSTVKPRRSSICRATR